MSVLDDAFGAWLKVVLPDSGIKERNERLGVIRTLVAAMTRKDLLNLVFTFYSNAPGQPTVHRIREGMRAIDTSFGPKDDAELAVLAAGVLYGILEVRGDLASTAALAMLCADFGALAGNPHIAEVVTKARRIVSTEGIRVREADIELPNLKEALRSALEPENESEEDADVDQEDSATEASLSRVVAVLSDYGDKLEQSLALIDARRAEQSDILYWLLSGRRQIEGAPLKGLKKEQAALFVALEFARLTRQIPGPPSASAILSSFLDQCKSTNAGEVSLEDCIQSVVATDGEKYLAKVEVVDPVISPISFALAKAEEAGWHEGWQNAVKTQTRLSATTKYPVLKIAEQLYREALLSRSLKEN